MHESKSGEIALAPLCWINKLSSFALAYHSAAKPLSLGLEQLNSAYPVVHHFAPQLNDRTWWVFLPNTFWFKTPPRQWKHFHSWRTPKIDRAAFHRGCAKNFDMQMPVPKCVVRMSMQSVLRALSVMLRTLVFQGLARSAWQKSEWTQTLTECAQDSFLPHNETRFQHRNQM